MTEQETGSTAAWPLPELNRVEITYKTVDRFGDGSADPCDLHAQVVNGEIVGIVYEEGGDETRVPLGDLQVVLIDLWEMEAAGEDLFNVLDSHSSDWAVFLSLTTGDEPELHEGLQSLLLLDRVRLVPEARGHGLGLHVLARAIRTWCHEGLVAAIPAPTEGVDGGDGHGPGRDLARAAIARHWEQLGFERLRSDDPEEEIVLFASTESGRFEKLVNGHCAWTSPHQDGVGAS